ncbi:hypothetical protein EG329_007006 [Mollisiaceae sp. DMI_Dod_QoI]|nr:hypothetical protein EG329_007006 [Helotiales sp. DMI_Dod_QoI]
MSSSSKHRKTSHRGSSRSEWSAWSQWEWNQQHAQWGRYRTNPAGEYDYDWENQDPTLSTTTTPRYVPDARSVYGEASSSSTNQPSVTYRDESSELYDPDSARRIGNDPIEEEHSPPSPRTEEDSYSYATEAQSSYVQEQDQQSHASYAGHSIQSDNDTPGYAQSSGYRGQNHQTYRSNWEDERNFPAGSSQLSLQDQEGTEDSSDDDSDEGKKPKPKPEPGPGPSPNCNHHGCVNGANRDPDGPEPRPPPAGHFSKSESKSTSKHRSRESTKSKGSRDKDSSRSGGRKRNEINIEKQELNHLDISPEAQKEFEEWKKEYETWKDVTCACGYGYYTIEGRWISGQA